MAIDVDAIRAAEPPEDVPFGIRKIGHVVLWVSDLDRSVAFYTRVLGFRISDVYSEDIVPGGMVFLRFNPDHHGVALVGRKAEDHRGGGLHHMAFAVDTLDEVLRARCHLRDHGVAIDFEGRRRAGVQIAIEFRDPDGHRLEIYWGLDQVGHDGAVRPAAEWKYALTLEDAIADPVHGQDTTLEDPSLLER